MNMNMNIKKQNLISISGEVKVKTKQNRTEQNKLGKERKGKERRGKERRGEENKDRRKDIDCMCFPFLFHSFCVMLYYDTTLHYATQHTANIHIH
jgi:hypothetical protein